MKLRSTLFTLVCIMVVSCASQPPAVPTATAPVAVVVDTPTSIPVSPTPASTRITVIPTAEVLPTRVVAAATPTKPVEEYSMDQVTFSLRLAYRAIVNDVALPVDPVKVAQQAMVGLVEGLRIPDAEREEALHANFTTDKEANYQILKERFMTLFAKYGTGKYPMAVLHSMVQKMAEEVNDCHTYFLDPDRALDQKLSLANYNQQVGVGMSLQIGGDGRRIIVEVFPDSPAEKAGLKVGDVIMRVDGRDVSKGITPVSPLLRGPENSQVRIVVERGENKQLVTLNATRSKYRDPVFAKCIIEGNIGYIRIYEFTGGGLGPSIAKQMEEALTEFDQAGVKGLVIDVRNNPGGFLESSRLIDLFVPDGLARVTRAANGNVTETKVDGKPWPTQRPMAVLINNESYSAAEIGPLALQEHKVAVLVGTQTTGCTGSAPSVALADGSELYYSGTIALGPVTRTSPHKVGLKPDIEVPNRTPEDFAAGRDPQLEAAITYLEGQLK